MSYTDESAAAGFPLRLPFLIPYLDRHDTRRLLFAMFCGLGYLVAPQLLERTGATDRFWFIAIIFKTLSIPPLALIAAKNLRAAWRRNLVLALLCSTLGDFFLALRGEHYFIFGLLSFLIAHLFYIALFIGQRPRPFRLPRPRVALATGVLAVSVGLSAYLLPRAGSMAIPVLAYVIVLTLMVLSAVVSEITETRVLAGALLFMLSDSLIGLSRFGGLAGAFIGPLIWVTYFNAQYLITVGFVNWTLNRARALTRALLTTVVERVNEYEASQDAE
ncbi:MAG: lysoplasmalogenase [Blastocatellia bacterium]